MCKIKSMILLKDTMYDSLVYKPPSTTPIESQWSEYQIISMGPQGWICPKCGKVFSPNTSECIYCNNNTHTYTTTTIKNPEGKNE